MGAGKDTNIYVVDRDNMGKFNASSNNAIYQELPNALVAGAWSMPALFNNTVYYAGQAHHLTSVSYYQHAAATTAPPKSANTFAYPGATPSVSSNGAQNGIVWAIENQNGAGVLHAYDPTNLADRVVRQQSGGEQPRHVLPTDKFVPPMIANGKVYVGTNQHRGCVSASCTRKGRLGGP